MSRRDDLCLRLQAIGPHDVEALFRTGIEALNFGLHEQVIERVDFALANGDKGNPRLWQLLGLARRGLDDCAEAHKAFGRAAALAPSDPLIAHSRARTALEAGLRSTALYAAARSLDPNNAEVIQGQAAAQMADGDPHGALETLEQVLTANPGWHDGHAAYARICRMHFPERDYRASLIKSWDSYPADPNLAANAVKMALEALHYDKALATIALARSRLGFLPELARLEAIALSDSGDPAAAQALFERLPPSPSAASQIHPVRALIRLGRHDQALRLAEQSFGQGADRPLWPYRALLWRLMGDQRWAWLEGDERLIGIHDLPVAPGGIEQLAQVLRGLHGHCAEPLGQSVRQGSQTDGNLFQRAEPEIRRLRQEVLEAVRSHAAQLPPYDPEHPTLSVPREPLRFAGAWSIRLSGEGRHVDHVHLEGWLSAACYMAVPDQVASSPTHEGWLAFGENRELLPDFEGFRLVQPRVGRLALFPSLMWHGTRAIEAGERMSVAFDMALPNA
jgi:tetratricopeptide (TPR) repeat protein